MKPVEIDTSLVNRRSSQDADSQVSEGGEEGSNEEESTNEEEESASSMTTTQAFEQSLRECQMKLQEAEERARASEMVHHLWACLFVLYFVLFSWKVYIWLHHTPTRSTVRTDVAVYALYKHEQLCNHNIQNAVAIICNNVAGIFQGVKSSWFLWFGRELQNIHSCKLVLLQVLISF